MEKYEKKCFFNDENTPYSELLELLHDSFKERLEANLNFGSATYTLDDLLNQSKDAYIVSFWDNKKPVAMEILQVKNKMGVSYGVLKCLAVSPLEKYRRKGLGGMAQKESVCVAKDLGLSIVVSSTAVEAVSSVRCQLKTGFKIYRLKHYDGKKYLSYVFFYPIKANLLTISLAVFRKPIYWISRMLVK